MFEVVALVAFVGAVVVAIVHKVRQTEQKEGAA